MTTRPRPQSLTDWLVKVYDENGADYFELVDAIAKDPSMNVDPIELEWTAHRWVEAAKALGWVHEFDGFIVPIKRSGLRLFADRNRPKQIEPDQIEHAIDVESLDADV